MQYAGISLTLKVGEKDQFEISCAKHLLNSFGQRGLTSLTYGCNEEQVGADAVARNIEFKKKQVVEYNQRNENRKQMGFGFLPPTESIKKYAIELGLKLLEPYAVRDEERSQISQTQRENEGLRAEIAELRAMMKEVLATASKQTTDEEVSVRPESPKDDLSCMCDVCGRTFKSRIAMLGHKRTHGPPVKEMG